MRLKQLLHAALIATTCLGASLLSAAAQDAFPRQRILMIIPFAAGGPSDIVGRTLADGLAAELSASVVVENRGGGNGAPAVATVAKSEPDGHTLLMSGEAPLAIVPALATPPYDGLAGLTPIAVFVEGGCNVLVVHPGVPARTLREIIAMAKAAAEPLAYASAGLGTPADTVAAEFADAAGITLRRVSYRGAALATNDVMGGHVPIMFPHAGTVADIVASGKLVAVAASRAARCSALPDVPTMTEQGFPLDAGKVWFGLFAPAGTPAAIADRLHRAVQVVVTAPDFSRRLAALQFAPLLQSDRATADAIVRREIDGWARKAAMIPGLR